MAYTPLPKVLQDYAKAQKAESDALKKKAPSVTQADIESRFPAPPDDIFTEPFKESDLNSLSSYTTTDRYINPSYDPNVLVSGTVYKPNNFNFSDIGTNYNKAKNLLLDGIKYDDLDRLRQAKEIFGSQNETISTMTGDVAKRVNGHYNSVLKDISRAQGNILLKQVGLTKEDLILETRKLRDRYVPQSEKDKITNKLASLGVALGSDDWNSPFYNKKIKGEILESGKLLPMEDFRALSYGAELVNSAYNEKLERISKAKTKVDSQLNLLSEQLKANPTKEIEDEYNNKVKLANQLTQAYEALQKESGDAVESILNSNNVVKEIWREEKKKNQLGAYSKYSTFGTRVSNINKNVLFNKVVGIANLFGLVSDRESVEMTTAYAPEYFLMDYDTEGKPVYSDKMYYKDKKGNSNLNPAAILETGATVLADMAITAALTRGLAGGVSKLSLLNRGTKLSTLKAIRAGQFSGTTEQYLTSKILSDRVASRALTLPSVVATTYPRFYFDNINKFDNIEDAHRAALHQAAIEGLTESIIPDINFFKGTSLFPTLSRMQTMTKEQSYKYMSDVVRGMTKGGFEGINKLTKTAKITLNNFLQEGLLEEGAAYVANSQVEKEYQEADPNYKPGNILDVKHGIESMIDSGLGMLVASIVGIPGNYSRAKQKYHYDFSNPKSLVNYQWNIATMPNAIKAAIKADSRLTPEQRLKANQLVEEYRKAFENSMVKTQKPNELTLGQDALKTYTHFGSTLLAEDVQNRILSGKISEEDANKELEKYNKVTSDIEFENDNWVKMPQQKKEDQWFEWYRNAHDTPKFSLFAARLNKSKQNYKQFKDQLNPRLQSQYENSLQALTNQLPVKAQEQIKEIQEVDENQPVFTYELLREQLAYVKPYITDRAFLRLRDELFNKFKVAQEKATKERHESFRPKDQPAPQEETTDQPPVDEQEGTKETTTKEPVKEETIYDKMYKLPNPRAEFNEHVKKFTDPADIQQEIDNLEAYKANNPDLIAPKLILLNASIDKLKDKLPKENTIENYVKDKAAVVGNDLTVIHNGIEYKTVLPSLDDYEEALQDLIDQVNAATTGTEETEDTTSEQQDEEPKSEPPVLLNDEDFSGEQYGEDWRTNNALISVSDEYTFKNKKVTDPFSVRMNLFINKVVDTIGNYSGKLISNAKLFKDEGVDIEEIRSILKEYWALDKRGKKEFEEYRDRLVPLFKGTIPNASVEWHLVESITDERKATATNEIYGEVEPQDKFDKITLRGHSMAITDGLGTILRIDDNGTLSDGENSYPVIRAVPKVKLDKESGRYEFYNIRPFDLNALQPGLKQAYEIQQQFLSNDNLEIPITGLEISQGFNKDEYKRMDPQGDFEISTIDNPILKRQKGMVFDSEGNRLWSEKLSDEDLTVISNLLSKPLSTEDNLYVNQLVYLTDDEKEALLKLKKPDKIKNALKDKHHNIWRNSINKGHTFTRRLPDGTTEDTVPYEDFVRTKLFSYTFNPVIQGGNKKIVYSIQETVPGTLMGDTTEEVQPQLPPDMVEEQEKRADIERRRQISLYEKTEEETKVEGKTSKAGISELIDGSWYGEVFDSNFKQSYFSLGTKEAVIKRINDYYDEELAALGQPTEKPTKGKKKKPQEPSETIPWDYSRTNAPTSVTEEEQLSAFIWFNQSFLSEGIDLKLSFLHNARAFASFTNSAITLYKGSDYSMLYHEAWHRFTQNFLTVKEKDKLYAAAKSLINDKKFIMQFEGFRYEEALAEAFRSFMLSGGKEFTLTAGKHTIVVDAANPKKEEKEVLSKFQQFLRFFTSIFSKGKNQVSTKTAEEVILEYMREASGTNTVRKSDPKNSLFKRLDTIRDYRYNVKDVDGELKEIVFDYASMYELNQGLDFLFVDFFNNTYSKNRELTFTGFLKQPRERQEEAAEVIYGKIKAYLTELYEKEEDVDKKLEYKAVVDNFQKIIQETSGIRKAFTDTFVNSSQERLESLENDETKIEIAETYENMSNQELGSPNVLNLIKLIPATDSKGNPLLSQDWKLPYLSDFNYNWVLLTGELSGLDYPQMLAKIEEMTKKHPRFKYLLKSLPLDETPQGKLSTLGLKTQWEQTMNMPRVSEMVTILDEDENGNFIVKFTEAGTTAEREIINGWDGSLESYSSSEVFKEFKEVPADMNTMLGFLAAIGIEFTDTQELINLVNGSTVNSDKFVGAVQRIYKHLRILHAAQIKVSNPISMIPVTFGNIVVNEKTYNLKGEGESLNILAGFEVDSNDAVADDMMLRADGNTSYKYNQYTYITKLTKALDGPYQDLIEQFPQFDIIKNPAIRNSSWFRALFFVDKNGKVTRTKTAALEFLKTGGLDSSEISNGTVAIDLIKTDKVVLDFYSFIQAGVEEMTRTGDKQTTGAFNMKGVDRIKISETDVIKERLFQQLMGELANIKHLEDLHNQNFKFPKSSKQYKYTDPEKKDKYVFFRNILQGTDKKPETKDELKKRVITEPIFLNSEGRWDMNNPALKKEIMDKFDEFFDNKTEEFIKLYMSGFPKNVKPDQTLPKSDFVGSHTLEETARWYYMNSTLNRMDQFNMVFGDPRNYANGDAVFKRLSAFTARGFFPTDNKNTFNLLNSEARYGRNIESEYSNTKRKWTNKFNIVQFGDIPVNLDPAILAQEGMTKEEKEAWQDYINTSGNKSGDKGKQSDASGAVTLDFYKALNMLIGPWDVDQQNAYNDQVAFVRAKLALAKSNTPQNKREFDRALDKANQSYGNLLVVFNPKKWQYAGSIYSSHTIASMTDMRAFLKFSIMPLIPSVIHNTALEKVAQNMYTTNTDLYVFDSGSKMTTDQPLEDFNKWSEGTVSFNPTVLDLRNFKEQLPINNQMKDEGIFASQMRKLLSVGFYENGLPVEGRDLTHYNNYKKAVDNITKLIMEDLKDKLSDPKKLVTYLRDEFDKRELPENVKDFLDFYDADNTLVNTLDTSLQSFFIQNILFSIVNSKLIRQKLSGGQFIQAPNTGYTNPNFKQIGEYKNDDLKFYENGSMEVKIAFTKKYEPLLNIVWNGKRIDTLTNLNSLLRDPDFIKEHGKKFTLVGCRIPVQGFSTIESMRVAQFLPPIAGQIVIVPRGLTIKSGSDFDIDKLNIYEPHIDRDGNLIDLGITNEVDVIELRGKILKSNEVILEEIKVIREKIDEVYAGKKEDGNYVELKRLIDEARSEEPIELTSGKFTLESFQEVKSKKEPSKKLNELLKKLEKVNKKREENQEYIEQLSEEIITRNAQIKNNKRVIKSMVDSEANRLIYSISNIILDPKNKVNLISHNELDYMLSLYKGQGIDDEASATDIGDVTDPMTSHDTFDRNMTAKAALSIAAKSNPLYALFMEAGMKIVDPSPTSLSRNTLDDGSVSMSSLHTQPYKNKLAKYKSNTEAMYIPKILSEFISATVDVANDARIGEIRFNTFLAPIYIYGIMQGTHLFDMTDLLLDPEVKDLVDKLQKVDSIVYKHFVKKTITNPRTQRKALQKNAVREVVLKANVDLDYYVIDPVLDPVTNEPVLDPKGKPRTRFNILETAKNVVKDKDKNPRGLKTAEFILLEEDAKKLTTLSRAVSWDTNTSKSFVEFNYPKKQLAKLKTEGFFDPKAIENLENESVIAPLNIAPFVNEYLGPLFSVVSKDLFIDNAINTFEDSFGKPLEDFSRDYTNDFFTYLYQNFSKNDKGESLYEDLIVNQQLLNKDNPNNIEHQLKDIKKRMNSKALETNAFLNKLIFKKDNKATTISPRLKSANVDTHTFNLLHQDLLKLLHSSYSGNNDLNAELRTIVRNLILSTSLLNGTNKTFGDFTVIIPTDIYTDTMRDIVNNKDEYFNQEEFDIFNGLFRTVRGGKYFGSQTKVKDKLNRYDYFVNFAPTEEPTSEAKSFKTESGNVIVHPIYKDKGLDYDAMLKYAKDNGMIYSLRMSGDKHFGNPFGENKNAKGLTKRFNTIAESVHAYRVWLTTDLLDSFKELLPRKRWILDQIQSGKLKGKPILYWKELNEPSHANVLDELINNAVTQAPAPKQTIGKQIVNDEDTTRFNNYLAKSNMIQPKEFFTSSSYFKDFYSNDLGRRGKAPQSSKWILNSNKLYDLVDKETGEVYIQNVDLSTGHQIMIPEPVIESQEKDVPLPTDGLSGRKLLKLFEVQSLKDKIAEYFYGKGRIKKEGYYRFGDKNVSNDDKSIRLLYFSNTGIEIDVLAASWAEEVRESADEIVREIVDFITENPKGPRDYIVDQINNRSKDNGTTSVPPCI